MPMNRHTLRELRRDAEGDAPITRDRVLELIAAYEELEDELEGAEDEIEALVGQIEGLERDAAEAA